MESGRMRSTDLERLCQRLSMGPGFHIAIGCQDRLKRLEDQMRCRRVGDQKDGVQLRFFNAGTTVRFEKRRWVSPNSQLGLSIYGSALSMVRQDPGRGRRMGCEGVK